MLDGVKSPIGGNAEVVTMFEKHLARAKQGKVGFATVTTVQAPDIIDYEAVGNVDLEAPTEVALALLRKRLEALQLNRLPPEPDSNAGADRVCYNVSAMPTGYDFPPWIIEAEMARIRAGAPTPLRIGFWYGQNGVSGMGTPYQRRMMEGVTWPMLELIGAIEDPSAIHGHNRPLMHFRGIVDGCNSGEHVPRFVANANARRTVENYLASTRPITITLREAEHFPHRNSNLPDWVKFAEYLTSRGETVVFLRDTAKAFDPLGNWPTFPRGSLDLHMRVALYELAKANLFISNGPYTLALFGSAPWLSFIEIIEDDGFVANHSSWWRDCAGIEAGSQFPWCAANQRIIWKRDTYENIVEAWEATFG